ncbi:RNA polymerase sigma factor [Nonomuraea sp. NPDC059194]|uniref:RNA polymerase sigma factor n=1 Tax=Nonomuraea sp. NPDC059194 TaxID=3346764 RepID=UPI0036C2CCFC
MNQADRFAELYEETYTALLGYALRRCHDPEDAADIVAETFAVAWRRIAKVPEGDEARLWLYGVARKALANHRRGERRHERRTAALRDQLAASPLLEDPPPGGRLAEALATLSEEDRELLTLVGWENLDHAQLATTLGISRNAVRVRLHRARRRLASIMNDHELEGSAL